MRSGVAGSTTIAPYIPFAMCISTGFVPQWYMKTPGSFATKLNVNDLPGVTSMNALFGAMRAAWKSIECGIAAAVRQGHLHGLALPDVDRPGRARRRRRPRRCT